MMFRQPWRTIYIVALTRIIHKITAIGAEGLVKIRPDHSRQIDQFGSFAFRRKNELCPAIGRKDSPGLLDGVRIELKTRST
jgi:hypothetical protein